MTAQDVLRFIEENDVKFIRLAFVDLFGQLKNIAIQPDQLTTAFETGVAIDQTAVEGFEDATVGDLILKPDPDTLCILPWRPQSGRVCRLLCGLFTAQGERYACDSRFILSQSVQRAADMGLDVRVSTDCEFYLFDLDERGRVTAQPHDEGGYMDVAPLDRCEDVRRDICLTLEQMNIRPESSHHERGRGQNEVDFHRAEPLNCADHFVAFAHAVRAVSTRYGVHATFLPKPLPGEEGNGLCVNLSLYRGGQNLFRMEAGELSREAASALAGVLGRLPELTLFLNPLPNSYERLRDTRAPRRVQWSLRRDGSAARVPLPQERFARMQIASPDPTMNIYLGVALLIEAALEGIRKELPLAGAQTELATLPQSLPEALELAQMSELIRDALPAQALERYAVRAKRLEGERAQDADGQLAAQILRF